METRTAGWIGLQSKFNNLYTNIVFAIVSFQVSQVNHEQFIVIISDCDRIFRIFIHITRSPFFCHCNFTNKVFILKERPKLSTFFLFIWYQFTFSAQKQIFLLQQRVFVLQLVRPPHLQKIPSQQTPERKNATTSCSKSAFADSSEFCKSSSKSSSRSLHWSLSNFTNCPWTVFKVSRSRFSLSIWSGRDESLLRFPRRSEPSSRVASSAPSTSRTSCGNFAPAAKWSTSSCWSRREAARFLCWNFGSPSRATPTILAIPRG